MYCVLFGISNVVILGLVMLHVSPSMTSPILPSPLSETRSHLPLLESTLR